MGKDGGQSEQGDIAGGERESRGEMEERKME